MEKPFFYSQPAVGLKAHPTDNGWCQDIAVNAYNIHIQLPGEEMKTEGSQCGQRAEAISSARLDSAGPHSQLSPLYLSRLLSHLSKWKNYLISPIKHSKICYRKEEEN